MSKSFLILGYGYTAPYLKEALLNKYPDAVVHTTSRSKESHIKFNLDDSSTWSKLPSVDGTFWLFPAQPSSNVQKLLDSYGEKLGKIIVVGSTSAFQVTQDNGVVNEEAELNSLSERVLGESLIRDKRGITVYASGIYGPGREPKSWVEKGYIQPSDKYLNLIHVIDLVQLLMAAFERGRLSSLYIASDQKPQKWNDLIKLWQSEGELKIPGTAKPSVKLSKFIDSSKTLSELRVDLKFPFFKV